MESIIDGEQVYYENCSNYSAVPQIICTADPHSMLKPWNVNPDFIQIIGIYSVTFVIGVLGNLVAIIGMATDTKSNSATTLFLLSLAVVDLALLALCIPMETATYFVTHWDESGTICRLSYYLQSTIFAISVLNLSAVSIERFIVIVFPMRSRSICTLSNCRKAVACVWALSPLLTIPAYFAKGVYTATYVSPDSSVSLPIHSCVTQNRDFVYIYQLTLLFVTPAFIMIVCYAYVIKALWISTRTINQLTNTNSPSKICCLKTICCYKRKENNPIEKALSIEDIHASNNQECQIREIQQRSSKFSVVKNPKNMRVSTIRTQKCRYNPQIRSNDVTKARKQVIKMLILVVALFLLCWGPKFIVDTVKHQESFAAFTALFYKINYISYLLPFIHSCVNPVIYSFMSKNFRESMKRRWQCLMDRLRGRKRRTSLDYPSGELLTRSSYNRTSVTPIMSSVRKFQGTHYDGESTIV
ncbi:galanin receptor 2a-like [Artemia franciscana]|uniref:G-protein coupled receptors family 1 profile domain-containing protein n=1 Tax=Artemia franciscana TaxID=6661 RepID=A0AA88IHJ9_ARTSF|nr:hypothetical protein QYM36_002501 [Artemia franciscana]